MAKVVDTGEIVCGFGILKSFKGQKDFDTTYKSIEVKQRVKKVGDGENDFIIEEYEEVTETPIQEVIDAQADSVGVQAFLRPYELAGANLPEASLSEEVLDVTNYPDDPADVMKVGDSMIETFNSIDPALRGDSKDVESFLNSLTQEKIDAYIASKLEKKEIKKDVEK